MSVTYSIGCTQCKKNLWIGQRGAGTEKPYLYGEEKYLKALAAFLNDHTNHPLIFNHDEWFDYNDYSEDTSNYD